MVQSLASRLRLRLPCAWALEGVKERAVTLSRERELHARQVASHAACTGTGTGTCKQWQDGRRSGSTGRQGERRERDRREEGNAGEPESPPRTP